MQYNFRKGFIAYNLWHVGPELKHGWVACANTENDGS